MQIAKTVEPYGKRLHSAARREFRTFWSDYRCWAWFAPTVLCPLLLQVIRHGWHSMVNLDETITNAVVGLAMALVGTYLIALRSGAQAIDTGLQNEISQRDSSIGELNLDVQQKALAIQKLNEKPKRTASEEYHFNLAKDAIERYGEPARVVLRHLHNQGKMIFGFYPPTLPVGMELNQTREILNSLKGHVVAYTMVKHVGGCDYVYEIAPAIMPLLDELIYP